jgi:uncharacterized protein (DUF2147 family)
MFGKSLAGVIGLALGLTLAVFGLAQARGDVKAVDICGVWQAQSRGALVRIDSCGEEVCGTVLSAKPAKSNPLLLDVNNKDPALRSRPMVGSTLITGFTGGPVKWTGGRLYNPGDGNYYHGSLTLLDDDHLQVKGCAFLILCKSQTWTRID